MNQKKVKANFNPLLFHTAERTFGELAFMLVVPEEGDLGDVTDDVIWGHAAKVEFTGPFDGEVYCAITAEMLRPLASNMLGIELNEEPPEGVSLVDALKELLNVVCGNLLPAIAGDEVVFQIGGPVVMDYPELPKMVEGMDFIGHTQLTLDSGKALIRMFVRKGASLPAPRASEL